MLKTLKTMFSLSLKVVSQSVTPTEPNILVFFLILDKCLTIFYLFIKTVLMQMSFFLF